MPAELHSQRHEILQEGLEPQHSARFVLLGSSNQKLGQGDFKKKTKRERKKTNTKLFCVGSPSCCHSPPPAC